VQAGGRAYVKAGAALRTFSGGKSRLTVRKAGFVLERACVAHEQCDSWRFLKNRKTDTMYGAPTLETQGRLFLGGPFFLRRRTSRLVLERVNDRDVGFDLDGLAVENGWLVPPLAHGVGGRAHEEWIAADHLQGLDRSVGGDDSA
jgi:hypothetical protein